MTEAKILEVIGALRVIENYSSMMIRWQNQQPKVDWIKEATSINFYARRALLDLGCQVGEPPEQFVAAQLILKDVSSVAVVVDT